MRISVLSFILAVTALGLSVFQYQRLASVQPPMEVQISDQNKRLNDAMQQIVTLQGEVQLLINRQAAQAAIPTPVLTPTSLLFYEISSAIHLSAVQLELAQDPRAAMRTLNWVYKKLGSVNDIHYKSLQEAVLQDKLALENVALPDVESIWLKLGILISEVDKLPNQWTKVRDDEHRAQTLQSSQSTPANWKKAFNRGWQELKDLIKIQHHDKPIMPLLSQEEQALSKQHLKLLLEEARWALLNTKAAMYQSSIQSALQWLERYFEPTNPDVQHMIKALSELEAIQVAPQVPNLDQTLIQLERLEKG